MSSSRLNDRAVEAGQYDCDWVKETWGWDTPQEFVRSQGRNLRPRIRYALAIADLREGMRVLDIGCGRGEVILHCARHRVHAVGVDYSKEVLAIAEQARSRHSCDEQKYMEFICDDVKHLEAGEQFDRIFMLDLVEHLQDWELNETLQVCKSLLKPEGQVVIHTLPNRWLYDITYGKLLRLAMPWLAKNPRTEKEMAIHINEMSPTRLHQLLVDNGFECRVWLYDLIVEQAKWHVRHELEDKRGGLYRWMRNPVVAFLYRTFALTPLRLLITNDIFAIAVHPGQPIPFHRPMRRNWAESLVCALTYKARSPK